MPEMKSLQPTQSPSLNETLQAAINGFMQEFIATAMQEIITSVKSEIQNQVAPVEAEPSNGKYPINELKNKRFLTRDETAFYLGISTKLLTKIMLYSDFYPLMRLGHNRGRVFVNREKLDQWLDEQDGRWKKIR